MKPAHGSTARAIASLIVVASVASVGCMSRKEVNEARHSVYDADFAVVYSAAVGAVRSLYPSYEEDPVKGVIKTSWHQVKYSDPGADDPKGQQNADQTLGVGNSSPTNSSLGYSPSLAHRLNFIRFDITVTGGRPWRVRVRGSASQMEPGNALPTEFKGANVPHWLGGRTDALVVAIHRRLKRYAVVVPDEVKAVEVVEAVEVDGDIEPGARTAVTEVMRALHKRDYAALRTQVADDVVWSLGAPPGAEVALAMWQADPTTLAALETAIKAGCGKDGAEVMCPAAPAPHAVRARFAPRGGVWKLVAFVEAAR